MNMLTVFFTTMFTQFVSEMGDKTQFMLITLSYKYRTRNVIIGTALSILLLNAAAVFLGGTIGLLFEGMIIKLVAAILFLFFALVSLKSGDEGEEKEKGVKVKFEALAVFITFTLAEFGDKTQFTAITFGASYGLSYVVLIWLSCSLGLFLADMLGMIAGKLFKNKIKPLIMNVLAFVIFSVYGFIGFYKVFDSSLEKQNVLPAMLLTAFVFTALFVLIVLKSIKKSVK
ncbi:MAG: TMEM165/GDT1 family protein [Treponema sp.]|nr:TMEM165/GDT1 family protein [Treponema sp.]